jgi:hypothetical protein
MIDDTVGGYRIRRGTLIGISIYAVQRDPRWRDPDAHSYQSIRFYDKDIVAARPNLAVMAFGARPHRCFGAAGPSGTIPACRGRSQGACLLRLPKWATQSTSPTRRRSPGLHHDLMSRCETANVEATGMVYSSRSGHAPRGAARLR